MSKWQNFFLQKMGTDASSNPYPMCESVETWGVWCMDIPFIINGDAKEPAKHSWKDEHGDDEYIPSGGLYMEPYKMKIKFGCKKWSGTADVDAVSDVRAKVSEFLEYLRTSGMMMLYSSYTRIGRKDVRLNSVDGSAVWKTYEGCEFLVFTVEFKVNDPVTDIVKSGNQLVEAV